MCYRLLCAVILFVSITGHARLNSNDKYFNRRNVINDNRYDIQEIQSRDMNIVGRNSSSGMDTPYKGFSIQFTMSTDLYNWSRVRYSGLAHLNPMPEAQIQYTSPWMLNNTLRFTIKLFAYFPLQFYDPTTSSSVENNVGNQLISDEMYRFNELRYEFITYISPYFSITYKDINLLAVAGRYTQQINQHTFVYESTAEMYLGKGVKSNGDFRRPIFSKLFFTVEHYWKPSYLPWWLQSFQVYTEYSFILNFYDAMVPNNDTGSYDFSTDNLIQFGLDFKLDWIFGRNVKISFPAIEVKLAGIGTRETVGKTGEKENVIPFSVDFDIIVALMF